MYCHLLSEDLEIGDIVIHAGVPVTIADIEIDDWIVNIATIDGGRVSFPMVCRVRVIRK